MAARVATDGAVPGPPKFGDRHSRLVDLLRFLLPATALVLMVLVALWPQLSGSYGGLIVPVFGTAELDQADAMRMHAPRYVGRTATAEPYEVTADSAVMDPSQPQVIHLDGMVAKLSEADGRDLRLTALSGIYHRDRQRLDLAGGLELTTSDGYRFVTDQAAVDLRQGVIIGNKPIDGLGPTGTLAADKFQIRQGGDLLRFEGRVKVTAQPERAADQPS